jgi:hypothetical protein
VSPDGARYSRSLLVIGWCNGLWNISYGGVFGTLGGNCSGSWGIDPFLKKIENVPQGSILFPYHKFLINEQFPQLVLLIFVSQHSLPKESIFSYL